MPQIPDNHLRSWEYTLRAQRKSPHTIRQYVGETARFLAWAGKEPDAVSREDVERWLADLSARYAPATAAHAYAGVRAFFKWLEENGDIPVSPCARIRPPKVPETAKDVVPPHVMASVLSDLDRAKMVRDAAIISLFYDTGMRASEMARVQVGDIDWEEMIITLRDTKNGDIRVVPFSDATAARLHRWLRKRVDRESPWLFTGQQGRHRGKPLTTSGYAQIVEAAFRGRVQGRITPHDLRHTFATHFMEDETARPEDLMTIAGWKTDAMARRYTKTRKLARAIQAHRRLSPVTRLGK